MRLVQSRPIPMPVYKGGLGWWDDFAQTGMIDEDYVFNPSADVRTLIDDGVRITSLTGGSVTVSFPSWLRYSSDFRCEIVARRVDCAYARAPYFRYYNSSNCFTLNIMNTGNLVLNRAVGGVNTTLASIPLPGASTDWYCVGVEAIGENIRVYLEGELVVDILDANNLTNKGFYIGLSPNAAGQSAEFQYVVYIPLT